MSTAFLTSERTRPETVRIGTTAMVAMGALVLIAAAIVLPLGLSFVTGGAIPLLVLTVYLWPALPILGAAVLGIFALTIIDFTVRAWHHHRDVLAHRTHIYTN